MKIFLLVFFMVNPWMAQENNAGKDSGLFPEIAGMKLEEGEVVYTPDNLWELINGAADAFLSYHFTNLHLAEYSGADGLEVAVELYRHGSREDAFGIYAMERSRDYHFVDVGAQGYLEGDILNFLSGNYYIKMSCNRTGEDCRESLLAIGNKLEKHLSQDNEFPRIVNMFPTENLVPYSIHYSAVNFLGLSFMHSAFSASYSAGEGFELFIMHLKSPEETEQIIHEYLSFAGQEMEESLPEYLTIHDPYNGDVLVAHPGNYLVGGYNYESASGVREYIDKVISGL